MSKDTVGIAAFVGLDWADQKHVVTLQEAGSDQKDRFKLDHTPESLQSWIEQLRQRFGGKVVAIAVEQTRGALIYALMHVEFLHLYPVNPQTVAKLRQAFYPSGAKDDPVDADLLLEILMTHRQHLRVWVPDDELTRSIQLLTEGRRHLVDERTALTNQLTAALKTYFPQAVEWFGELHTVRACAFLDRWPSLQVLKAATPSAVRKLYKRLGYRGEDKLEQLITHIQQAQPLTRDGAVILSSSMMVQALVNQISRLTESIERCLAASPERGPLWPHVCWRPSVRIVADSNVPRKSNSFPELLLSPRRVARASGFTGVWPVASSCGKPSRNLPDAQFFNLTGLAPTTTSSGTAETLTMPLCALSLTSGFAFCFVAGNSELPMTKLLTANLFRLAGLP